MQPETGPWSSTQVSVYYSCNPLEAMAPGPNMWVLDEKSPTSMVAMVTMATGVIVTDTFEFISEQNILMFTTYHQVHGY